MYIPSAWADKPATTTPIDKAHLDKMELGIQAASKAVDSLAVQPTYVMDPKYLAAGSYGSIQTITDADNLATINAKLTNNNAIVMAAVRDRPNEMTYGPRSWIQTSMVFNDETVCLDAWLEQWRGNASKGYSLQPALYLENLYTDSRSGTPGALQLGQNLPGAGMYTEVLSTHTLPIPGSPSGGNWQGDYSIYKSGQAGQYSVKDPFMWAVETGLTQGNLPTSNGSVWRAEDCTVHGISLKINAVSMTAATSAYPAATFERHLVKGVTSNVTALVNSWAPDTGGATGTMIFGSLSGDFKPGEDIIDVDSGTKIGTAGAMSIVFFGRLKFDYYTQQRMIDANTASPGTYTTTEVAKAAPNFRLARMDLRTELNVRLRASHDVDVFLAANERGSGMNVHGAFSAKVNVDVQSGFSRAVMIKSCHRPLITGSIQGVANHALSPSVAYSEQAYGYGIELRGTTYFPRISVNGRVLRHLITTNPNGRTWEVDATAHLDYGCGAMFGYVYDCTASDCFGAAFDSHEGAWGMRWVNCNVTKPSAGYRNTTGGGGFQNRGFNTSYENCHVDGGFIGFNEQSAALTAGIRHHITYRNCTSSSYFYRGWYFVDAQSGLSQDRTTNLGMFATISLESTRASGDPAITTSQISQAGYDFGVGQFNTFNAASSSFNHTPIWMRAGGMHDWCAPKWDYSHGVGTSGVRFEGLQARPVNISDKIRLVQKSAGVPTGIFRIQAAADGQVIRHDGVSFFTATDDNNTQANRTAMFHATSGGTPVMVDTSSYAVQKPQIGQLIVEPRVTATTAVAMYGAGYAGRATFYPQVLDAARYDAFTFGVAVALAGGAGFVAKLAVYPDDGSGSWPDTTSGPLATADISSSLGAVALTKTVNMATAVNLPAGTYWLSFYMNWTTAPTALSFTCISSALFPLSIPTSSFPNKPRGYQRTGLTDLPADTMTTSNTSGSTTADVVFMGLRRSA